MGEADEVFSVIGGGPGMAWPPIDGTCRGEAMPRPHPATPCVAHHCEAMPRPNLSRPHSPLRPKGEDKDGPS